MEKIPYRTLINGEIPPWVMRFIKHTGKAINTYSMIREQDTVLLSASGGKDSLALALALSIRRNWLPITYNLKALMINWIEHPIPDEFREKLTTYFTDLGYDFTIVDEHQYPESFKGEFNCYLCSRNRRRVLFNYCEEHSIGLVAMGHHLDDLVETSLMNLCFRANFSTMQPVQPFFDGKIHIIRPMIEIHESVTQRLADVYDLPVVKPVCPYDQTNIRARLKPIIKDLSHLDKLSREHIYHAHQFTGRL
ncbi:ATP-binding protein [Sphaerochaeta globosa]|uniref:PP-loop domain protein n=1 Tax=Sphaerochaeta globosa (strain ATCC BAA-1886 / DSM 22777 / Buddy) TaxID=158189 RepID=F0RWA1_SPHGB|nr:tRNA 2-thiocytidine biosynthesis TtcA family protein [Sphaerochaeta globosa]ADY13458.1 PP-loop domain protein [Sphaerochaeta globosa str. Buddy]